MRRTILLGLSALLIVGAPQFLCAQHAGGTGRGEGGHGLPGGSRNFHGDRGFRHDRGLGQSPYGWGGYPYGFGYADLPPYDDSGYDDFDNDYSYQPAQPLNYYQQPSQPVQPPQHIARQPEHPFVQEYTWPAPAHTSPSPSPTTSDSEPQTFAIVLKNGSTLSATMVLASDRSLQYVDSDGKLQRVDIAEVDRAATLRLDRARNLNIYLPAAQ